MSSTELYNITKPFGLSDNTSLTATGITLTHRLFVASEMLLGFCILLTNSIVLYIMVKWRFFHRYIYIANLSIADLLVGVCVPSLVIASEVYRWPRDYYSCVISNSLINILMTTSAMSFCAMCVDRMVKVCFGSMFRRISRFEVRVKIICMLWTVAPALILAMPVLWPVPSEIFAKRGCQYRSVIRPEFNVYIQGCLIYALVNILVLVSHWLIYQTFRRSTQRMTRHTLQAMVVVQSDALVQQRRLVYSLSIIYLNFLVTWTPLLVINIIQLYQPELFLEELSLDNYLRLFYFSLLLNHASALFNSLIFCLVSNEIRKYFLAVLGLRHLDGRHSVSPSTLSSLKSSSCGENMKNRSVLYEMATTSYLPDSTCAAEASDVAVSVASPHPCIDERPNPTADECSAKAGVTALSPRPGKSVTSVMDAGAIAAWESTDMDPPLTQGLGSSFPASETARTSLAIPSDRNLTRIPSVDSVNHAFVDEKSRCTTLGKSRSTIHQCSESHDVTSLFKVLYSLASNSASIEETRLKKNNVT